MSKLSSALTQWNSALGASSIVANGASIKAFETTTFKTDQKIAAALFPETVAQVLTCLKIATANQVPVYPVSRGRNCGYGNRVPYRDGSVLLDLSRLNNISFYDAELGAVTLEPGVTQEQLSSFLIAQGSKHIVDAVVSFPDCSVIGNILERGHGMTSYCDRVSHFCDLQVALPNGDLIRTGFSDFTHAKAAGLDRWAPGPNLDGLFTQSNFGVVTKMTVWLSPKPEATRVIAFSLNSDDALIRAANELRALRHDGTIKNGPRFFNEYRLLQTYAHYPWREMAGATPLSQDLKAKMQNDLGVPLWTGLVALYGTTEQIEVSDRRIALVLSALAEEVYRVDGVSPTNPHATVFEKFAQTAFRAMNGEVSPVTQRPRWRKKLASRPNEADWSRDSCGIIWCPVTVPFRGEDAIAASTIYRETFNEFGFEPDMSISAIRDRTLEVNSSIIFDREDPVQDEAAIRCAAQVIENLSKAKYYPHRLGIPTMDQFLKRTDSGHREILTSLKKIFDPANILAPGRYF